MKKILFVALILCFALSVPIASFAAATFTSGDNSSIATGVLADYKTSKNVEIHVLSDAQSYAATAAHLNGDREFGSASSDSVIYYQSKAKNTNASDPTASDSGAFSGWSQL